MSGKISGIVWEAALPQNEKFVLLAYADHADHEGNGIFPSVGLIAWKTGYSKRNIPRIKNKLVDKKILLQTGTTLVGVPIYKIVVSNIPMLPSRKQESKDELSGGDNLSGVTPVSGGGDIAVSGGGDIAVSPKPSVNPSSNRHSKREASPAPVKKSTKSKKPPTPKPEAVKVYHSVTSRWPNKALDNLIGDAVGDKPEALQLWEKVIREWIATGWNPLNVKGMLDFYRRGEIPGTTTERGNNGLRKGNRGTQDDDEWAEYTAKSQQALAARIAAVTVS